MAKKQYAARMGSPADSGNRNRAARDEASELGAPITLSQYNDSANAKLFIKQHGHAVRYVKKWQSWLICSTETGRNSET